jgi:hypothetical protein
MSATASLLHADPARLPPVIDLSLPHTAALRGALPAIRDHSARRDLLFLERWEIAPEPGMAQALRVQQIRRANPELAAAIRAEIAIGRR